MGVFWLITLVSFIMIPQDVIGQSIPANKSGADILVRVGNIPSDIAVNPSNNLVYVANSGSDTVSVINSTTNEVLTNGIKVGDFPRDIAVNPSNNLVYLINYAISIFSNTASVINSTTNEVLTNGIKVGNSPSGIAVNPSNNLVYLADFGSDTVSVIDN